ncbi:hypothetical protein BGZ65_000316 [Modicella reniformis]|uniref:Uncharacterized protein n=1 Tax=Modicella reniformis TaxID=1440133 RepID=A0A9P6INR5_9FUNG|nr:hypothetical protein BGZ65_000316 [Modicella reniformis]
MQALAVKRQKLLRDDKNEPTMQALQDLSKAGKVLQTATSIQEIEDAQQARRQTRQPLQAFESSSVLVKDRHTQRLRTERARHTLGAAERRHPG